MYWPVLPSIDPVPPSTNQCRPILTQYHQVSTSTALNWPSTIMYQQLPPSTDPVPPSTNKYWPILTQDHHIWTSTTPYWPGTTKYQPVPTYTIVAWGLQTPAQFTLGLVILDLHLRCFFAIRLDSRQIKKFPIHRIHRMFKRCYFQTSLKHDNFWQLGLGLKERRSLENVPQKLNNM